MYQNLCEKSAFLHPSMKVSQPWGGGCNIGSWMKKL